MSLAIGIMSGTSVDAVDAVLLEVQTQASTRIRDTVSRPFAKDLREAIVDLMLPGDNEIDRAGLVHTQLGELYAQVASELIPANESVEVIGCHGQTVRHRPEGRFPFTLQLGNGAVIAGRTGIPTVTDFRSADIAAGGQGAPFAPFFHHHVFSSSASSRAIVNLGGIANVTLLPRENHGPVTGFDTGPANCLLDLWISRHQDLGCDVGGRWASTGTANEVLLERMLADPYFHRPPPKSTGREHFNEDWLESNLNEADDDLPPEDVQATLTKLTAESISRQIPDHIEEIYLCGGGAANDHLRDVLQQSARRPVSDTSALGIPPQWIEAAAFGWMALSTIRHSPCTLPSVTGAERSSITGAIYYP